MTECFYSLVIILWWISEFEFQDNIQYYEIGQISPELQVKGEKEMSIDQ